MHSHVSSKKGEKAAVEFVGRVCGGGVVLVVCV